MKLIEKLNRYLVCAAPHVRIRKHCRLLEEAAVALNDSNIELRRAHDALALAHAILAKLPSSMLERAAERAAIKHVGDDPLKFIASVVAGHEAAKDATKKL